MKWWIEPAAVALGIVIVVVFVVLMLGFSLRGNQPSQAIPTPVPVETPMSVAPTEIPTTLAETTEATPEITPVPTPTMERSSASPTTPNDDADKYYNLPYKSTVYNPKGNLPPTLLHQTYEGKFQREAVVVKALEAPLIIDFLLTSAQGPTRSRFLLTVKNNETQELLAQEGFYGAYSENPQKRFYFSAPGTYHIDLYGTFVTVELTVRAPG